MKLGTAIIAILHSSSLFVAEGACNVNDNHPENGGYFVEGIAGFSSADGPLVVGTQYKSHEKSRPTNSTWVAGGKYPDGSLQYCTGPYCSETCRNDGCPTLIESTTCSQIRFCYASDSGSDVWALPSEMALSKCDFTEATQVCDTSEGSDDDCCNFMVEEDAELQTYFFASKSGCAEGQKAAVRVGDYDEVGLACYNMGTTTSRISKCTCNFEDRELSSLSEPCHSQFIGGCMKNMPDLGDDTSCCDTGTCVGNHKNYEHPIGKALEDDRKTLCRDDIPGRCTRSVGGETMHDCCSHTCSSCGIDKDPWYTWSQCDSGNATASSGECGYSGSHYSMEKFTCDFTQCADDHIWQKTSDVYKAWMKTADPEGYVETDTPPVKESDSHSHESKSEETKVEESKSEETKVEESKSAEVPDKSTDDTDGTVKNSDSSAGIDDNGTVKSSDSSAGIAGHVIGAVIGIFITFFSF